MSVLSATSPFHLNKILGHVKSWRFDWKWVLVSRCLISSLHTRTTVGTTQTILRVTLWHFAYTEYQGTVSIPSCQWVLVAWSPLIRTLATVSLQTILRVALCQGTVPVEWSTTYGVRETTVMSDIPWQRVIMRNCSIANQRQKSCQHADSFFRDSATCAGSHIPMSSYQETKDRT